MSKTILMTGVLIILIVSLALWYIIHYQDCDIDQGGWDSKTKALCQSEPLHIYKPFMNQERRLPENIQIQKSDDWHKEAKNMVCLLCNKVIVQFDFTTHQQLNNWSQQHNVVEHSYSIK